MFTPQPVRTIRRGGSRAQSASRQSTPRIGTPDLPILGLPLHVARLATPSEALEVESESGVGSAGGGERQALLRAKDYTVSVVGSLPAEVRQMIGSADLGAETFRGALDEQTGYAYMISFTTCSVWNYNHRPNTQPPLYKFPLPRHQSRSSAHASFAPHASREPGLLVCSADGRVRYWDGVGRALTSVEKYTKADIEIAEGEEVNGLVRWDRELYILSTTQGRLFRLSLTAARAGGHILTATPVKSPRGVISRVTSSFFRSGVPAIGLGADASVKGMALGKVSGRRKDVWVAKAKSMEMWGVERDGGEHLMLDQNMQELLGEALVSANPQSDFTYSTLDVQLLDVACLGENAVAALFSYSHESSGFGLFRSSAQPRTYAVAVLEYDGNALRATILKELRYRSQAAEVRLAVPGQGSVAFVQFPDAVVLLSLNRGVIFQEVVPLKDERNCFLGSSAPSVAAGRLSFLTATSGVLGFDVDLAGVERQTADLLEGANRLETATAWLKAKIEQAISFGDDENPLSFDLLTEVEGDLMAAVEAVSGDILSSTTPNLRPAVDLRLQLAERKARIENLINFINGNRLLEKLSLSSRWNLCSDGEKMAAANALWSLHDNRSLESAVPATRNLLVEAIEVYTQGIGQPFGEDVMRHFFRSNIRDFGVLIDQAARLAQQAQESGEQLWLKANALTNANRVVLTIYDASNVYRGSNEANYGLKDSSPVELWTNEAAHVDVLYSLIDATLREFEDLGRNSHNQDMDVTPDLLLSLRDELKAQLPELATVYLRCMTERLDYLELAADDAALRNANAGYLQVRPNIIHGLVKLQHSQLAFQLAEQYEDWRSLIELCEDPSTGSPAIIEWYMHKHRDVFPFQLYQWYIEKGKLHQLLTQNQEYASLVDEFLQTNQQPRIAWIHYLTQEQFDPAAKALAFEAGREPKVEQQKVLLSIGKLCELAQAGVQDLYDASRINENLRSYDDGLNLVSVHDLLRRKLEGRVPFGHNAQPDILVNAVVEAVAENLQSPALLYLFKRFAKQLLQGRVLPTEDLIDLLTLKDNGGDEMGDYLEALEVYKIAGHELPVSRAQSALQAIWRRVFIHDNWPALMPKDAMTDSEIQARLRETALYATLRPAMADSSLQDFILRPSQCLATPTADECRARFGDFDAARIEELQSALYEECRLLRDLIRENEPRDGGVMGLEEWYSEVQRSLHVDQAFDVTMDD